MSRDNLYKNKGVLRVLLYAENLLIIWDKYYAEKVTHLPFSVTLKQRVPPLPANSSQSWSPANGRSFLARQSLPVTTLNLPDCLHRGLQSVEDK